MRRVIPIVLALVLIVSIRTSAQDLPTAQKWENVEWFNVISWQFTNTEVDTAMTILFDIYMPVLRETMPGSKCLRFVTGEWHVTCMAPLPEGPASLEWQIAPAFADFLAGVAENQGEAAMGIFEMWNAAIARESSDIAFVPSGGM